MNERSSDPAKAKTISPEEAEYLKGSEDWIEERDWLHLLKIRPNPLLEGLHEEAPLTPLEARARRQHLVDALRDRFEYCVVEEDADGMFLSLGNGVVYKIGATMRESIADILGIIIALLTTTNYFVLLAAWTGFSIWKIIRNLIRGYEELTDPAERQVLETLIALSGRMTVTNYDALAAGDYGLAYGAISPTASEIADACHPALSLSEVESALAAMQEREIVSSRNHRWAVCF